MFDANQITAGAVLTHQVVAKRGGFWPATVTLLTVTDYKPLGAIRREGDRWFRCSGTATVAGRAPLTVTAIVLVCSDIEHTPSPVWERV